MERPANQGPTVQVTCSPSPQTPNAEFLTQRDQKQNKNNFETQSSFASELKIENIDKEIKNLDFDPEEVGVTQQMSDGDSGAKFAFCQKTNWGQNI
jgi:hypothetical protein